MKRLTNGTIQALVEKGTIRVYERGQLILYEGDISTHVYYIYRGAVKVYEIDSNGNEKIISIIGKGDLFPILPILAPEEPIQSFHGTLSKVDLVAIPNEVFLEQLKESNDLALYCLKWSSKKVKELFSRISSMEKTDTKTKLYGALMFLGQQHSKKRLTSWRRVNFPVSQQLLADLVGVTRESINSAIQSAQEEEVMRSPKNLTLEINIANLNKLI